MTADVCIRVSDVVFLSDAFPVFRRLVRRIRRTFRLVRTLPLLMRELLAEPIRGP